MAGIDVTRAMRDLSALNAIVVLAGMLGACTSLAPDRQVPQVVSDLPSHYQSAENAEPYRPTAWWRDFEDGTLNALVDDALQSNLDIAEAAARLERANAQARIARSGLFPSIDASASASYSDSPLSGSALGGFGVGPNRLVNESYGLSLGASYELDLLGRVRSGLLARRADAFAAQQDFRAVQLAAAAETIAAYFDIVDGRRQIELTLLSADVLEDRVARTEERYRRGLVQSFELYQVRQDLRDVQASLPLRESALDAVEGRLALLLRDFPENLRERLGKPLQPRLVFETVPTGLPQDLLAQRPDVAAAWQRLEAARYDIGARRAERFPALRLNASAGSQAGAPGQAFNIANNWALSLASNIVAPIFNAGRISAQIASSRATYDERAAAYVRAVLGSYREVSSAIEDYEEKRQRYRLILSQLSDAQSSMQLQARRFRSGVGTYIAYLDAMRAENQVRANLSSAGRDVALARLGVHRALGGDWVGETDIAPNETAPIKMVDAEVGSDLQ